MKGLADNSAGTKAEASWLAVDWGTTHLRVWAMDAADGVIASAQSDEGMGRIRREDYEPALLRLAGGWLAPGNVTPAYVCGMAGSRQGWREAPYRAVPCAPIKAGAVTTVATADPRLSVRLIPGLRQDHPADVMRGEETQIAGFLRRDPDFDGVLCLPGTHCKWVRISAGEVVGFQTYMTGEMFGLLSQHSVLRHAMPGEGWDEAAFLDAVAETISRPEKLAQRLFSLRATALLEGAKADTARARLSGLLIGAELAGARGYWLGQRLAVIGAPKLSQRYRAALAVQGVETVAHDAAEMTRTGLIAARAGEAVPA